jgi:hypothetical protein
MILVFGASSWEMVGSAHEANRLLEWQCAYESCKQQQPTASTCSQVSRLPNECSFHFISLTILSTQLSVRLAIK